MQIYKYQILPRYYKEDDNELEIILNLLLDEGCVETTLEQTIQTVHKNGHNINCF